MKTGPIKDESSVKKVCSVLENNIPPHSVHMNMSLPQHKYSDQYQVKREQWITFVKQPKNTLTKT